MDNLFNNILANVSADITIGSAIITMLVAVVFGAAIGFTYYKTQEENYQRSMAVTLLMLPIILSVIILFIGSNIARAFSLAGTLEAPGDLLNICLNTTPRESNLIGLGCVWGRGHCKHSPGASNGQESWRTTSLS